MPKRRNAALTRVTDRLWKLTVVDEHTRYVEDNEIPVRAEIVLETGLTLDQLDEWVRKMDLREVQSRIDAIVPLMSASGMKIPRVQMMITSQEFGCVLVSWGEYPNNEYKSFRSTAEDWESDVLSQAEDWARSLPSLEARRRDEFVRLLAAAIEKGHEAGIEDSLVNPLEVLSRRLSENALESAL